MREALQIRHAFNDVIGVLVAMETLAWVAAASGDPRRAAGLLGASCRHWRPLGSYLHGSPAFQGWHDDCLTAARDDLGAQRFEEAHRAGGGLTLDQAVSVALGERLEAIPAHAPPEPEPELDLTRREREVAELVTDGLSNKEIATRLVISRRTAESHVEHILSKLGFSSRAQIAAWLSDLGRGGDADS